MANDEMNAVEQRLAQLEKTVAKEFSAQGGRMDTFSGRMDRLEDRVAALDSKLDIFAESIRDDIKTVLEAVTAGAEEMRRKLERKPEPLEPR